MAHTPFLSVVSDANGVSVDRLSATLHITKSELAIASGLSRDDVAKAAVRNSADLASGGLILTALQTSGARTLPAFRCYQW